MNKTEKHRCRSMTMRMEKKISACDVILNQACKIKAPRVALMQPTFLPWQGYFGLILAADIFIFLDDYQFCRRSFHQRNRLFLPNRCVGWITIPVEHTGNRKCQINKIKPLPDEGYLKKFKRTLQQSYGKTQYFKNIFPFVKDWIDREWNNLADMNIDFIKMTAGLLGLKPEFLRSSALGFTNRGRSRRLAAILESVGAASYLSAKGSYHYMAEEAFFPLFKLETYFQHFIPKAYHQNHTDHFESHLSVLDSLFQVGPQATIHNVIRGQEGFIHWNDMQSQITGGLHGEYEHLDQR